jgi:hypothetical protein
MYENRLLGRIFEKCIQIFVGDLRGRDHLEDLSIDGTAVLGWILEKQGAKL